MAEQFTAAFTAHIRGMTLSTAYDFSADMGSLISEDQMKTVVGHVEDAKAKGAKVIAGGHKRPDIGPTFFEPTVLTDVTDEMDCARNETFGPVVSIYPVDSVEEAIEKANDSEYGLNASVWAGSKAQGEAIAARLRTGTVNVDEGYALAFGSTAAPMGGMKSSGVGRRHGPEGILKYLESQTVATARVINLDPPLGVPKALWQKALIPMVQAVQKLPGR